MEAAKLCASSFWLESGGESLATGIPRLVI
jgi:hypothetical protein